MTRAVLMRVAVFVLVLVVVGDTWCRAVHGHPVDVIPESNRAARSSEASTTLQQDARRQDTYVDEDLDANQEDDAEDVADAMPMAQHFFPSFFPSLEQSRPLLFQNSSPRPAHRSHNGFQPVGYATHADSSSAQSSLLGSGNFGVIRGGTYYNDADHGQSADYDTPHIYSPYYHNGHGRPAYYNGNPRPQPHADFFANFRDFADINTPTKSSFSEMYVVYVNKNASQHEPQTSEKVRGDKPKNIIEQLAMIDSEEVTASSVPLKKSTLSASKLKLAKTFKRKGEKVKTTPKDLYEPLLALS